jgi:8-oxo-dGTP diphosphatase
MSWASCVISKIDVVAGIIVNSNNEILIALRPKHVLQGDLWEFPGGKVEANESPYQALVRELKEEINIIVTRAKPYIQLQHEYPERIVMLDVWWIEHFEGEPQGHEGQTIRWATPQTIAQLPFPEGNKEIIEMLKHTTR